LYLFVNDVKSKGSCQPYPLLNYQKASVFYLSHNSFNHGKKEKVEHWHWRQLLTLQTSARHILLYCTQARGQVDAEGNRSHWPINYQRKLFLNFYLKF